MFPQTLPHFECQIQTRKIRIRSFEQLHHAYALAVVIESAVVAHTFSQHLLAGVAKGRVSKVVRERYGFREVFIQA